MYALGTTLPYGVAVGNHDLTSNDPDSTQNYNSVLGLPISPVVHIMVGITATDNDSSYILFSASNIDFIAVFIEVSYLPVEEVFDWMEQLLVQYPNRLGIIVSHAILEVGGTWEPQEKSCITG